MPARCIHSGGEDMRKDEKYRVKDAMIIRYSVPLPIFIVLILK